MTLTLVIIVLSVCYAMAGAFFAVLFSAEMFRPGYVEGFWHAVGLIGQVVATFLFWPVLVVVLLVGAVMER